MSEKFKLAIQNFQTIKDCDIEFESGLNVVVGETNQGKSAIIRAIRAVVYNNSNNSQVNIDADKMKISVDYNDHKITLVRNLKKASPVTYKIDGNTLTKLGRTQSSEVAENLGMKEIELGDSKVRINFSEQMSYPFLLDKTPSQLFKFLVQSNEQDGITNTIDTMFKDYKESLSQIKALEIVREKFKENYNRERDLFNQKKEYAKYADKVIKNDTKVSIFNDLDTYIDKINDLNKSKENFTRNYEDNSKKITILKSIEIVPEKISTAKEVLSFIKDIEKLNKNILLYDENIKNIETLLNYYKGIESLSFKIENTEKINTDISVLSDNLTKIEDYTLVLQETSDKSTDIADKIKNFDSVSSTDKFNMNEKIESIYQLKEDYGKINTELLILSEKTQSLEEINTYISDIETKALENEKNLNEFEVCPLCGKKL